VKAQNNPSHKNEQRYHAKKVAAQILIALARTTQSLEPIFFPKLQIEFADFPYLRSSIN